MRVYPSLMAADMACLGASVSALDSVQEVAGFHLDIMDNHFVPNFTFGAEVAKHLKAYTSKPFEAHLMVNNPMGHFEQCAKSGVSRVFTHIENTEDVESAVSRARSLEMGFGLAINPETPLAMAERYIGQIDSLLVMAVNPGFCGQSFLPETLMKIEEALALKDALNEDLRIVVDGGMNAQTIPQVKEKGITDIVAGNAVFSGVTSIDSQAFRATIKKLI